MSRRWAGDTAALAAAQMSGLAAGAGVSLVAAAVLGPKGKGELALAFAVGMLLSPIAAGGVDTYLAARPDGIASWPAVVRLGRRAGWLGGVALAAVTLVAGAIAGLGVTLVVAAAVGVALRPSFSVVQAAYVGRGRVRRVATAGAVSAGAQVVAAALVWRFAPTPAGFALASCAGAAACLAFLPLPRAGAGSRLEPATRRSVLRYGRTAVAADALQMATYRIDVLLLAALAPIAAVGVYTVAVLLSEVLWQIPNAAGRSLLPRLRSGDVKDELVVGLAARIAGLLAVAAVGLVAASVLGARPLLGAGYADLPVILALLIPGTVALGAAKPLAALALSRFGPGVNVRASAAGFVTVLLADIALIPVHGARGAAVASSLGYCVIAVVVKRSTASAPARPLPQPLSAGRP